MDRRAIGIAINGVTGRMGYRQHLVRSLLAIREQGGLSLADGTTIRLDNPRRAHITLTVTDTTPQATTEIIAGTSTADRYPWQHQQHIRGREMLILRPPGHRSIVAMFCYPG